MTIRRPIASWNFAGTLAGLGGTLTNTSGSYVPGRDGQARRVTGPMTLNAAPVNALGGIVAWSASLWLYIGSAWDQYDGVVCAMTTGGSPNYQNGWGVWRDSNTLYYQGQGEYIADPPMEGMLLDNWNHVVVAANAAHETNVYLNGRHQFRLNRPPQGGGGGGGLSLVPPAGGFDFDQFDLFDIELHPSEVAALFAGERP